MIHYITMLVALVISGVAGFFSVYGIGIIFSGSFVAATIMGGVLEAGKVVAVSWLYRHFNKCSMALKIYLMIAIVILSLITSLGIFGFLSRAHLEQSILINNGTKSQIELTQTKISQNKEAIADYDRRISLINKAQESLIASKKAVTSLRIGEDQNVIRNKMNVERNKIQATINELEQQKVQQENEIRRNELDIGPIRYVAEAIFGASDQNTVDRTVRFLIMIIMVVFDPLAIALIIAANQGLMMMKTEKILTKEQENDMIKIGKSDMKEIVE